MQTMTAEERFFRKVERTMRAPGCWLWTGSKIPQGYGRVRIDGKALATHRVSWEMHRGPIPKGLHVLHYCDEPACVNPNHLFLGTHTDNMRDMFAKGRCDRKGEAHGSAKLTSSQVREIRAAPNGSAAMAEKYGVSYCTIKNIRARRTWAHL